MYNLVSLSAGLDAKRRCSELSIVQYLSKLNEADCEWNAMMCCLSCDGCVMKEHHELVTIGKSPATLCVHSFVSSSFEKKPTCVQTMSEVFLFLVCIIYIVYSMKHTFNRGRC